MVEHLRHLVHDQRVTDNDRVKILYALRRLNGLDRLRGIRDDKRTRPAIQWAAANRLRDHAVEDGAAGAWVLHAIATNTTYLPTLRWRAASDLTGFGERGRDLGVASLQAITADEALPVIVRVAAACVLGTTRPDLRRAVLRLLRGLRTTKKLWCA